MRAYFSPQSAATLAVPYSPKSAGSFRVHRPKFLQWQNCSDFSLDAVVGAFFEGVDAHEQGAKVWNAASTNHSDGLFGSTRFALIRVHPLISVSSVFSSARDAGRFKQATLAKTERSPPHPDPLRPNGAEREKIGVSAQG
jgi:hypothetical protein